MSRLSNETKDHYQRLMSAFSVVTNTYDMTQLIPGSISRLFEKFYANVVLYHSEIEREIEYHKIDLETLEDLIPEHREKFEKKTLNSRTEYITAKLKKINDFLDNGVKSFKLILDDDFITRMKEHNPNHDWSEYSMSLIQI